MIITKVNDNETSTPCNEKKLAKLPSTMPSPIGRNDKNPNTSEVV